VTGQLVHCGGCGHTWTDPGGYAGAVRCLCTCFPGQPRYEQWAVHPAPPAEWYGRRVALPGDYDLTMRLTGVVIDRVIGCGTDLLLHLDGAGSAGYYLARDTRQAHRLTGPQRWSTTVAFRFARVEGTGELARLQAWADTRASLEMYAADGCHSLWFCSGGAHEPSWLVMAPIVPPDSAGRWDDVPVTDTRGT
jgi:hypothetical protein